MTSSASDIIASFRFQRPDLLNGLKIKLKIGFEIKCFVHCDFPFISLQSYSKDSNQLINILFSKWLSKAKPFIPSKVIQPLLKNRQTNRQTDRQTDTQTHRHTDTQTHRHTDSQTHRYMPSHTYIDSVITILYHKLRWTPELKRCVEREADAHA